MADTISTKELEKAKELLTDVGSQLSKVVKDLQNNMNNIVDNTGKFTSQWQQAVKNAENLNDRAQKYVALDTATSFLKEKINDLKSKSLALDALGLQSKINELQLQSDLLSAQLSWIKGLSGSVALKSELLKYYEIEILKTQALSAAYAKVGISQNKTITDLQAEYDRLMNQMATINDKQSNFGSLLSFSNKLLGFQIEEFFTISGIISKIFAAFTSVEDASFEVRKNLGLIGNEGDRVKTLITDSYVRFANLGVTAETVGKTINSIANGLGSSLLITQEMVENFSIIETSLGIASEQSAKVARTFAGISKSSSMSQSSMIGFVKELSRAAGTSFVRVMEDLANLGESVRLTFRGTSVQLIKSTVEARRLGLSISDVGAAAEKLLDFQESINAEIEASVMLGKNISFNDARVLAYRGDILGATKQILDTVEKTADLNQLDYFTLKAIAASTGLTVDKLQESLQIRKDLQLVESMGTEEARKQLSLYKSLNNMSDGFAKSEGERAIENLKNTNNLALQKQLQTELNGLILQLGQAFLPVLQALGTVLQYFTDINTWLRTTIGETGGKWVSALLLTGIAVMSLKGKWMDMFSSIYSWIVKIKTAQVATGAAGGAAGAVGSAASGVAMWKNLLGAAAIIVATAGALYIIGKALKEFPADIGGMGYMEFFLNLVGGLSIFLGFATVLGALIPTIAPMLGLAALAFLGLSLVLGSLGLALQSIANPIKTFSDSFSKLIENINVENLSKMKDGVVEVKSAMAEIREELSKFTKDDLDVLNKLGTLKTNITYGVKGEGVKSKETENATMTESIKSAVIEGMKQVKIYITLDGRSVGTGVATAMSVSQPASAYTISTNQGAFK